MDEGMFSAMWRCLSEGGGVGGTGWDDEVPWVGEDVGLFRIWEGCGALLDELLLLEFLVVKTGIVYRRVG